MTLVGAPCHQKGSEGTRRASVLGPTPCQAPGRHRKHMFLLSPSPTQKTHKYPEGYRWRSQDSSKNTRLVSGSDRIGT